jgi:perosamine synthetase
VNGTAALHAALVVAGVGPEDEVITQPLTFVATANAIRYCGAVPAFTDVDTDTMGMSALKLAEFLDRYAVLKNGVARNRESGRRIAACLPVHIFGHPCRVDAIVSVCEPWGIPVVEDSAEAMGTLFKGTHAGRFGRLGVFSFNGNKIVTTGGGGAIVTDSDEAATLARHLTTTARCEHPVEFFHDRVGFNYRMPNVNAALGCAQMEQMPQFLGSKRDLALAYASFFRDTPRTFMAEPEGTRSNYWLNAVMLETRALRDGYLKTLNANGIMARPVWRLMNELEMNTSCITGDLTAARHLADRVVCLPSSVRP